MSPVYPLKRPIRVIMTYGVLCFLVSLQNSNRRLKDKNGTSLHTKPQQNSIITKTATSSIVPFSCSDSTSKRLCLRSITGHEGPPGINQSLYS